MLINASKMEEEDGLRKKMGRDGGCFRQRGLLGTRNEFIKGNEGRNFPLESFREEVRFYGNSSPLPAYLTPVLLCGDE
jgi:hypothetical protein